MKIKGINETLSEYDLDCMVGALLSGEQGYDFLKKKNIVVASIFQGGLERHIIHLLQFINEKYDLQMELYSCDAQNRDVSELEGHTVDLLIYTGICNRNTEVLDDIYHLFNVSFVEICERIQPRKLVLLSDYRIMAQSVSSNVIRAESEINPGVLDLHGAAAIQGAFETMCVSLAHQYSAEYFIIRTGAILGWDIEGCAKVQKMINQGSDLETVGELYDIIPYLYISDLLQAMLIVLGSQGKNEVYHAVDAKMIYTGYEILGIRYRLLGERPEFKDTSANGMNYAMAGEKLQLKGFSPQIDIDQAMVILQQYNNGIETPICSGLYGGKIRKIQKLVLGVMIEIDKLCSQYQIPYALGGGTLLGAVRHQGFIPWDEDADLIMERDAYERFLRVAQEKLPDWLFLQTPKTDKNDHFYTKIRVNDTVLSTTFTSRIPGLHQGVFVDIFCHDKTSKYKIMQKIHMYTTILARSMVFNKWGGTKISGKSGGHAFLRAVFTCIKDLLPMSVLEKFQFWVITCYKNRNTGFLFDGMGQNIRNGAFPQEWLKDIVLTEFETYQFPIPAEYDKYLTYLYGDYQKKVSVRERFDESYAKRIDLGKYFWQNDI